MSKQKSQQSSGFSWQPPVPEVVSATEAEPNTNAGLSYGKQENAVPTDPNPSASGSFAGPDTGDGGQPSVAPESVEIDGVAYSENPEGDLVPVSVEALTGDVALEPKAQGTGEVEPTIDPDAVSKDGE